MAPLIPHKERSSYSGEKQASKFDLEAGASELWVTYIMRKTRYHGYPDLVCTHGQMWIRRYQEVMEQSHISHGLISSDAISVNLKTCQLLTNTPGIERRFTISRGCGEEGDSCVVWMMFAGYSHRNPALMQWSHSGCLSLHLILRRLQL